MGRDVAVATEDRPQQAAGHRDRGERADGVPQPDVASDRIDPARQRLQHRQRGAEPGLMIVVQPGEQPPCVHGQVQQNQDRQ